MPAKRKGTPVSSKAIREMAGVTFTFNLIPNDPPVSGRAPTSSTSAIAGPSSSSGREMKRRVSWKEEHDVLGPHAKRTGAVQKPAMKNRASFGKIRRNSTSPSSTSTGIDEPFEPFTLKVEVHEITAPELLLYMRTHPEQQIMPNYRFPPLTKEKKQMKSQTKQKTQHQPEPPKQKAIDPITEAYRQRMRAIKEQKAARKRRETEMDPYRGPTQADGRERRIRKEKIPFSPSATPAPSVPTIRRSPPKPKPTPSTFRTPAPAYPGSPSSSAALPEKILSKIEQRKLHAEERDRKIRQSTSAPGRCQMCQTTKTGQWRRGPDGPRTLCNACGLDWSKRVKAEARFRGVTPQEAEEFLASAWHGLKQQAANKEVTTDEESVSTAGASSA
ncbi:hypothetical protein HDU85_004327 [Gaertneriomyces sp. JEL0708]|nr:hypothetical protein HDU85_004327 [Gaertneriomyces sp. JEL0708]